MEASALQAPATLSPTRVALGTPLMRFRSDEQLVALFRAGHDEAFRAIHDRYHKRLFAYARQMLPGAQDAEDALQDVFVRAYAGLRASNQELALRAWLFRVAHNRCIDELRRPAPPPPEVLELVRAVVHDPVVEVDLRETLRRLIEDIRRLPEQQRSALLMRELAGMSYADLSASLGISVGAVKSLLVRARVALAQAAEARDASCLLIREQLVEAHDRGLRPGAMARKHMRDCVGCKSFRRELRGMSRQLAAVAPAVGPLGVLAKTLGFSGGAGGGAAGTGGGLALLGGSGAGASAGGLAVGVNHAATLLVAAVAAAGGAVELQHAITPTPHHATRAVAVSTHHYPSPTTKASSAAAPTAIQAIASDVEATVSSAPKLAASADTPSVSHVTPQASRPMTSDAAFGGPVSGDPELSRSSSTTKTTSTTSTKTAKSHTGGSSGCSSLVSSQGGSTSATSSSSSSDASSSQGSTSGSTTVASVPVNDVAQTPCAMTTSPSTGTSGSSTSTTTPSSSQSPSQSGISGADSSTSTGGSTPAEASQSSSSPGTTTAGGSGSTTK